MFSRHFRGELAVQVGWHEPTTPVGIDWEVMMFLDIRRGIEALHCSDSIRSWHFQSGGLQSLHCSDPVRRWGELNRYRVQPPLVTAIQLNRYSVAIHLRLGSLQCSDSSPQMGELNRYSVAISPSPTWIATV